MGQKTCSRGISSCSQEVLSKAGEHDFYCDSVVEALGGAKPPWYPISHPPPPSTLGRAGCCAARVHRRRGIPDQATPFQLHPGAAAGLGMVAGRVSADRAQVLSPGLSQAALSASRESHQQPNALCALAACPRKRCLQKSHNLG